MNFAFAHPIIVAAEHLGHDVGGNPAVQAILKDCEEAVAKAVLPAVKTAVIAAVPPPLNLLVGALFDRVAGIAVADGEAAIQKALQAAASAPPVSAAAPSPANSNPGVRVRTAPPAAPSEVNQ